eukprot:6592217-Pyramimonas_sp.AAC.1
MQSSASHANRPFLIRSEKRRSRKRRRKSAGATLVYQTHRRVVKESLNGTLFQIEFVRSVDCVGEWDSRRDIMYAPYEPAPNIYKAPLFETHPLWAPPAATCRMSSCHVHETSGAMFGMSILYWHDLVCATRYAQLSLVR